MAICGYPYIWIKNGNASRALGALRRPVDTYMCCPACDPNGPNLENFDVYLRRYTKHLTSLQHNKPFAFFVLKCMHIAEFGKGLTKLEQDEDLMNGHTRYLCKYIWKLKIPLKIKVFMWFLSRKCYSRKII